MEQILIQRLRAITDQLKILSDEARLCINSERKNVEVICSKLDTAIKRFTIELHNYFRISQEPSADEISEFSSIQLQAEELYAELIIKNKTCSTQKKQEGDKSVNISGRLPKLDLPEFDGDVLNWSTFWDQFSSNIDNRNLPDVDKLLYLKAALKGEAKKVVEGLETTNKNYGIALSTLKERYGKESQIIDAHYSALYKIKAADTTVLDCRRTLNSIERHLRVLSSLGEDINHSHLRFIILEKFPSNIIFEMKMKLQTDSIEEMRRNLELIISAKEDASRISHEEPATSESYTTATLHANTKYLRLKQNKFKNKESYGDNSKKRFDKVRETATTMTTYKGKGVLVKRKYEDKHNSNKEASGRKRMKLSCIFCKEDHFNDECKKYKSFKDRMTTLKGLCFICFRHNHLKKDCRSKRTCTHCRAFGKHNRALCPEKFPEVTSTNIFHTNASKPTVVLQTAIVKAMKNEDNSKYLHCRMLMDSGSQRSYVTQRVAKELELPVVEENLLAVFTFGTTVAQELESQMVKLQIVSRTNNKMTIFANVVPVISQGVPHAKQELSEYEDKFILADDGSLSDKVDILIGNDYYYTMMLTDKVEIKDDLFLVNSKLGWILSGKVNSRSTEDLSVLTYFQSSSEMKLNEPDLPLDNGNVKSLWDLESIGITDSPKVTRDEEAIKNFNETTKIIDNRYAVCWPWIEYPPNLPSNYGLAYSRLVSLLKRLDNDTLESYDRTLKFQLDNGIIETVPESSKDPLHPVHYLPHHGVSHPGKPIRIVYDASAKTKDNKSLNQCLYCGPLMLENLTELLLRFRSHKIGLSADVEKAFLQIALQDKDRDVTRFLWLKDITKAATEDNLEHLRFCRVPFGVISSPFLLNATIRHHLMKSDKQEVKNVAEDIYVDNLVTSTRTVQEADTLYEGCKEAFKEISMNMREWSSNSKEFVKNIPDTCNDSVVKVLGLNWDVELDTIQLRYKNIAYANTKRGILKTIASVYDPCGFAVPHLLPAKLFLQELWKQKIKWDAPLSEEMSNAWNKITNNFNDIQEVSLPRCYAQNDQDDDYYLHGFADASMQAYAAVVYIVKGNEKSFVIGKSRLVPVKDQEHLKIPRLELLGALIGSRLLKYVLGSLQIKIKQKTLWTDSQIVLDWCNSDKLLTPFVARRVEEIKRDKGLIIRHVPSEFNPADVGTRPNTSKEDKGRWLSGPEFLVEKQCMWPTGTSNISSFLIGEGPMNTDDQELPPAKQTKDTSKELEKDNHQLKVNEQEKQDKVDETYNHLKEIRKLQEEHFSEEIKGKETNLSRNLRLFLDVDGILRCKGRMKNANWSFDKRYPILIPKSCEFTNKLILRTHNNNYHVGANHTLSIIRQSYWIPQGKSQVQKILKKCPSCVKHGGGPYKLPPTPALPPERVNYSSPFTFTGVDYLGPVLVNNGSGNIKRWICLFTCLAVRAIHLEVVQDLSAEEGILALRRMIASRGVPALITSDNALHFKLMSEILAHSYCVENKIRWRFIPALTPWFGGFYERLVGIVKHCMKRTLQKHLLKDCELLTVMKEIEAVVNTRPLTCVDTELEHILRPSDFLTVGKCITMESSCDESSLQGTTTKRELVKGWKRALKILEEFKEMFANRYLPSLRERYWNSHKEPRVISKLMPCEGQVVQIKGDCHNREGWRVGKVVELIKGADGLCRVAKVKIGNKEFTRSISHLYPLEVEDTENLPVPENKPVEKSIPKDTVQLEMEHDEISEDDKINEVTEYAESVEPEKEYEINEETQKPNDISKENNQMCDDIVSVDNMHEVGSSPDESRPKRGAAIRALEKIKEWTRNLVTLLQ